MFILGPETLWVHAMFSPHLALLISSKESPVLIHHQHQQGN